MEKFAYQNIEFRVSEGVLTAMINMSKTTDISIPSETPGGQKIKAIGTQFCDGSFGTITIPDDIEDIAAYAFEYAHARKVIWPKACKCIREGCFESSRIKKIENIDHVTFVGRCAFYDSSLQSIIWPTKYDTIPERCFFGAKNFKKMTNNAHVTTIGKDAFNQSGIESFVWPTNCKKIPDSCFYRSQLRKITNIENVTEAEYCAFSECQLEEFTIPLGVTEIPNNFLSCNRLLSKLIVHDNIRTIDAQAFACTGIIEFDWPSKCETIPYACFQECKELKEIRGIENVLSINKFAFTNCENLVRFKWPMACQTVPEGCFYECCNLGSIELPDTVTEIEERAFMNTALKTFKWPEMCTEIPWFCFQKSLIEKITNIANVRTIGFRAFAFCDAVKLDLSELAIVDIHEAAFEGVKKDNVIFPYYAGTEDIDELFKYKNRY